MVYQYRHEEETQYLYLFTKTKLCLLNGSKHIAKHLISYNKATVECFLAPGPELLALDLILELSHQKPFIFYNELWGWMVRGGYNLSRTQGLTLVIEVVSSCYRESVNSFKCSYHPSLHIWFLSGYSE